MRKFTVEETNLIAIYNPGNRPGLLENLQNARMVIDEPEMLHILNKCIQKISAVTDEMFSEMKFEPAFSLLAEDEGGETE